MTRRSLTAFLALSLLLTMAGCKKSGGGNSGGDSRYYMKFKANADQRSYTTVSAVTTKSSGVNILVIAGAAATTANNGQSLNILVNSTSDLAVGDHFTATLTAGGLVVETLISFVDNTASGKSYTSSAPNVTPGAKADVIITAINATEIKGTFSATLVDQADYRTVKYTVTEGEFNSKLTRQQ